MIPTPSTIRHYHVFLASPGDVNGERTQVRKFFQNYNRHTAHLWNAQFDVIDWENCSTIGVGRPQELITRQTLEKYRESLVLIIGIMAQRFGSPSGVAESGTEEEFNWAMEANQKYGTPEIKWYFRRVEEFKSAGDPAQVFAAVEQWKKVCDFHQQMNLNKAVFSREYPSEDKFAELFHHDVSLWLGDKCRPWSKEATSALASATSEPLPEFDPQKYREAVIRQFDTLNLEILDQSGANCSGVRLLSVFVPQSVRECHEYNPRLLEIPKEHRDRLLKDGEVDPKHLKESEEQADKLRRKYFKQPLRPALDATDDALYCRSSAAASKIVLLGDPGSGKSSLMRYFALRWALAESAERDAMLIPLSIDLQTYSRWKCDGRKTFVRFLEDGPGWYSWKPGLLGQLLGQFGRVVLLLDGLDEVFELSARNDLVNDIQSFVGEFPEAPVIVTSRAVGYQGHRLRDAGFRHFMLQDLSQDQINEFIDLWHDKALANDENAAVKKKRLLKPIDQSKPIAMLTGNPLLLTMMATLNRNQELPRDRADLYEQAARLLLHQWDTEHALIAFPGLSEAIGWREKSAMLRQIAYYMQAAPGGLKGNMIDGGTLAGLIEAYLREDLHVPESRAAAEAVVRHLRERNFILCFVGADSYAFVHGTFLEYFCAAAFVHQFNQKRSLDIKGLLTIFDQHCADDAWREVLRLICGQIDAQHTGQVIGHLVASTNLESWDGKKLPSTLVLAVWCLTEVRNRGRLTATIERLTDVLLSIHVLGKGCEEVHRELLEAVKNVPPPWIGDKVIKAKVLERIQDVEEGTWGAVFLVHFVGCVSSDRDFFQRFLCSTNYALRWGACEVLSEKWPDETTRTVLVGLAQQDDNEDVRFAAVRSLTRKWSDQTIRTLLTERAQKDSNEHVRHIAMEALAEKWSDRATRRLLSDCADRDTEWSVRCTAVRLLAENWPDGVTRALLLKLARKDGFVRESMLPSLVEKWPDEKTRTLLVELSQQDFVARIRIVALQSLVGKWTDQAARTLLMQIARRDKDEGVRIAALQSLREKWSDDVTRTLLEEHAEKDVSQSLRVAALKTLAEQFRDDTTRTLIVAYAQQDTLENVRTASLQSLADNWPDDATRTLLVEHAQRDVNEPVRCAALQSLAEKWPDTATRELLAKRAKHDGASSVRTNALRALTDKWPDTATRTLLVAHAQRDSDEDIRTAALQLLAKKWPDMMTRELLVKRAERDANESVRGAALQSLAERWPDEATRALLVKHVRGNADEVVCGCALQSLAENWRDEAVRTLLVEFVGFHTGWYLENLRLLTTKWPFAFGTQYLVFAQILPTRDLNGLEPYLAAHDPIPAEHIERAAEKSGIPKDRVGEAVRSLSQRLGWDVTKGRNARLVE